MSPCKECGKDRMNDPQGNYPMKFIGKPEGILMKGAPGNYIHGKVYHVPYSYSRRPFWELLADPPTLKVDEPTSKDSVYDEPVYVPSDTAEISITPSAPLQDDEVNINPDTGASIEPYMSYNVKSGEFKEYTPKTIPPELEPKPEVDEVVDLDREELKQKLVDAGVEFNDKARTTTLKRLVDELASEEES